MADVTGTLTGEEYLNFQREALDYLYDMPIANDSLFLPKIKQAGGVSIPPYRIKKITYNPPKLKWSWDAKMRHSFLEDIETNDTVTIEWYEDAFNSVQKWVLGQLNQVMDFSSGMFEVHGVQKIKVDMSVYHFAYVEGNANVSSPFDSVAFPQCTEMWEFTGMRPEGISDITYDADGGGSLKTVSVVYHCDNVKFHEFTGSSQWMKDDVPPFVTNDKSDNIL